MERKNLEEQQRSKAKGKKNYTNICDEVSSLSQANFLV